MVDDQLVKCILWTKFLYSKKKINVKPLFPISKVPLCQPEKTNT